MHERMHGQGDTVLDVAMKKTNPEMVRMLVLEVPSACPPLAFSLPMPFSVCRCLAMSIGACSFLGYSCHSFCMYLLLMIMCP